MARWRNGGTKVSFSEFFHRVGRVSPNGRIPRGEVPFHSTVTPRRLHCGCTPVRRPAQGFLGSSPHSVHRQIRRVPRESSAGAWVACGYGGGVGGPLGAIERGPPAVFPGGARHPGPRRWGSAAADFPRTWTAPQCSASGLLPRLSSAGPGVGIPCSRAPVRSPSHGVRSGDPGGAFGEAARGWLWPRRRGASPSSRTRPRSGRADAPGGRRALPGIRPRTWPPPRPCGSRRARSSGPGPRRTRRSPPGRGG